MLNLTERSDMLREMVMVRTMANTRGHILENAALVNLIDRLTESPFTAELWAEKREGLLKKDTPEPMVVEATTQHTLHVVSRAEHVRSKLNVR